MTLNVCPHTHRIVMTNAAIACGRELEALVYRLPDAADADQDPADLAPGPAAAAAPDTAGECLLLLLLLMCLSAQSSRCDVHKHVC